MTEATIELAHHKLTRSYVQEITEFLAHSSKWSWIDFQWSIEKKIEHKDVRFFTLKYDDYRLEAHLNGLREVVHFIVTGDTTKHSLIVLLAVAEGQLAVAGFMFKEGYTCAFENKAVWIKYPHLKEK